MKKSQSSDYFNRLEKEIGVDEEGNTTVGKNLKINGTTKLNGGFNPIHEYSIVSGEYAESISVYFESQSQDGWCQFVGKNGNDDLIYGIYQINNGTLIKCIYLTFTDLNEDSLIVSVYDIDNQYNEFQVAYVEKTQSKIYKHTLTLRAGTTNYVLMYDCTDNASANSLQDLRTIMKIRSSSDSVIIPVVNTTDLSTAGLQVTTSFCKIGRENVVAVSDKVTTL